MATAPGPDEKGKFSNFGQIDQYFKFKKFKYVDINSKIDQCKFLQKNPRLEGLNTPEAGLKRKIKIKNIQILL